jgi:amino acid transporter
MADQPATRVPGAGDTSGTPAVLVPPQRLEADAIGVTQDTVIGMASSAPAAVMALILASLAGATAYGSAPSLIVTAIPMLIIAFAYHRLNMWNANCGASFEWVGRAINPYLGWYTGWLMIAGYVLGTISVIEVLGPSVLAIFSDSANSTAGNVGISIAVGAVMLILAVIGIRITARTQLAMAVVEYTILLGMAIWGLFYVLGHHPGTYPISRGWFSLTGVGGKGSMVGGFLIAVFAFSGWDGTVYVNEEVTHRRKNPGRAAIMAVVLLTVIYVIAQFGLQGVVSPDKLQSNSSDALVYVARALGGSGWEKVMALALALSAIASTNAGILLGARITYGMASYRALPGFLASVPRRFSTPAAATILFGVITIGATVAYLVVTSVQNAFTYVVNGTGLLFALFYIMTAAASLVYYRRRIFSSVWNSIALGVLPLASAVFLIWMTVKSSMAAPAAQNWSLFGILIAGVVLMIAVRVFLKSPFFGIGRESDSGADVSE